MSRPIRSSIAFLSVQRLVMNTAYRFVYPFLPAISRSLGVPLEQVGLLISARHIAGFATPAVTRAVGRGEQRRRLMVTGLLLFIVGSSVTVLWSSYVGALLGFALIGIAKPVFDVSSQAYIADRVPYAKRARYLSVFEFTWAGALLVGAPLTGWLITRTTWTSPFLVFAVLTVATLAAIPRFIDRDGDPSRTATRAATFTRSGVAFLTVAGLFAFASEMIVVVFGAWLEDAFGLSIIALSGAAVLIGVSELVGEGATFAVTDRIGKRRAVLSGLIVSVVGFGLLVPAQDELGLGLAILALALFGFEFTIVSSIPLATELAPLSRARFLAWMVVTMSVGRSIGAAIGPTLYTTFGIPGPAILASLADVIAILVLMAWVKERVSLPGESVENEQRRSHPA